MYRRYYSYNNMPVRRECAKPQSECCEEKSIDTVHNGECEDGKARSHNALDGIFQNGKILGKFEIDDVLLFVVILVLLMDECDDSLLLLALGFVFISGIM